MVTLKRKIKRSIVEDLPPPPETPPVARVARQLALAYLIDDLVESGQVGTYAKISRQLGVSRARLTQIVNLRWLPIVEQEAILLGKDRSSERARRAQSKLLKEPKEKIKESRNANLNRTNRRTSPKF